MVDKTFPALCRSGLTLNHDEDDTKYAEWLVIYKASLNDIWEDTNLEAMKDVLNHKFDDVIVMRMRTDDWEAVLLLDPEKANEAEDDVLELTNYISQGQHVDLDLYNEVMDEAVHERWSDYEIEDRLELLIALGESPAAAFMPDHEMPDGVRLHLQECLEHA